MRASVNPMKHDAHTDECSCRTLERIEGLCDALSLAEIAALDDLALRNYCISATYHRISRAMFEVVGPGNATWCTFAAWASEQAGRSIRLENIPLASLDPLGCAARIRDVISLGNLRVFAEIAFVFERFIAWMRDRDAEGARRLARAGGVAAVEALVACAMGFDPRTLDESPDGQELLIGAFASYLEASWEPDPDARAELVFVGNAMVGLHEQTRVDPEVLGALALPEARPLVARWERSSLRAALSRARGAASTLLPSPVLRGARALLRTGGALGSVAAVGTLLMELRVGADVLALCEDITPVMGEEFPAHLRTFDIARPHVRARLARVMALDKTPHTLRGSAATDWTRLDQRMNFILDLFRSRQQSPAMFGHPLHVDLRPRGECACRRPASARAA